MSAAGVDATAGARNGGTASHPPLLQRLPWCVLSGTALKWVAIVTMLVDHVGAIFLWDQYLTLRQAMSPAASDWYQIYLVSREIGRIAFPIFCFVLAEGFAHTHSRPKYALRLFLFALISEVPYDFALHDTISFTSELNVMFTLLLAFCALWLAEILAGLVIAGIGRLRGRSNAGNVHGLARIPGLVSSLDKSDAAQRVGLPAWAPRVISSVFAIGTVALAAALGAGTYDAPFAAGPFDVSYHSYGIALIGVLYLARGCWPAQIALGGLTAWWYCVNHDSWLQIWSLLGLASLALYNGTRGRGMKYFFYVFYPGHLLILGLLHLWLG